MDLIVKINKVQVNNRKKTICIETKRGLFEIHFSRLNPKPTAKNKIRKIFIDKELGNEAVTYILESGVENSIHLDVFLDYNKDPSYLRFLFLFELTIEAQKALKNSKTSKNELCRRLQTSPSQLARLLDQTNQKKSVDKMLELLAALGVQVKPKFEKDVA
jgi:hypothetical protein